MSHELPELGEGPDVAITARVREDVGALAHQAVAEMTSKAEERAKQPIPLKHDANDELWCMVTELQSGRFRVQTITPLPMGLPAIELTAPCREAIEPNVRLQYAQMLEASKLESRDAARERAARAEVRVA